MITAWSTHGRVERARRLRMQPARRGSPRSPMPQDRSTRWRSEGDLAHVSASASHTSGSCVKRSIRCSALTGAAAASRIDRLRRGASLRAHRSMPLAAPAGRRSRRCRCAAQGTTHQAHRQLHGLEVGVWHDRQERVHLILSPVCGRDDPARLGARLPGWGWLNIGREAGRPGWRGAGSTPHSINGTALQTHRRRRRTEWGLTGSRQTLAAACTALPRKSSGSSMPGPPLSLRASRAWQRDLCRGWSMPKLADARCAGAHETTKS